MGIKVTIEAADITDAIQMLREHRVGPQPGYYADVEPKLGINKLAGGEFINPSMSMPHSEIDHIAHMVSMLQTDADCAVFIDVLHGCSFEKYLNKKLGEAERAAETRLARSGMGVGVTGGTVAINAERVRQVIKEGWESSHDDEHNTEGQLAWAARCYLVHSLTNDEMPHNWPWQIRWWKPGDDTLRGRKRDLEKAGALIAAEWDRLDRLQAKEIFGDLNDLPPLPEDLRSPFEIDMNIEKLVAITPQSAWSDTVRNYVARRQEYMFGVSQPPQGRFNDVPDGAPQQPPESVAIHFPPVGPRYHTVNNAGERIDITEDMRLLTLKHAEKRKCETSSTESPSDSQSRHSSPSSESPSPGSEMPTSDPAPNSRSSF